MRASTCWAASLALICILVISTPQLDIDLQKRGGKGPKLAWKVSVRLPPCIRNRLLILSIGHGLRPQNSVTSETLAVPLPSLGADMKMSGGFLKQGLVVNFKHPSYIFPYWPMSTYVEEAGCFESGCNFHKPIFSLEQRFADSLNVGYGFYKLHQKLQPFSILSFYRCLKPVPLFSPWNLFLFSLPLCCMD